MNRICAKSDVDQQLALALIESDRSYFELAARIDQFTLGQLCWMPGLNELAASCVVHRIVSDPSSNPSDAWLHEIESSLLARSIPLARIYLDDSIPEIDDLLERNGYKNRCEVGFLSPQGHTRAPENIQLRPVLSSQLWDLKLALHGESIEGPDGYTNQADLWVEMERRKCEAGEMQSYLVYRQSTVVATVGAIVGDGLLRLKNIVVHPKFRRQGIALGIVQHLWQMAESDHGCRLGVFGMEEGKGSKLYRRAGLYSITKQYEWSKTLTSNTA